MTVIAGLVVFSLLWGLVRGSFISMLVMRSRLTDCILFFIYFYLSSTAVRRCCGRRQLPRSQGMLTAATPPMVKPVGHIRLPSNDRPDSVKDGERTLPGSKSV